MSWRLFCDICNKENDVKLIGFPLLEPWYCEKCKKRIANEIEKLKLNKKRGKKK